MKHYTYGGSTASRTLACPAWRALSDTLPPRPTSSAAELGSALHKVLELCIADGLAPSAFVGETVEGVVITTEHVQDKVRPSLDAFEELFNTYDIDLFDVEVHTQYAEDTGGTMDIIGLSTDKRTLVIGDFKTGEGVMVSPEENAQGLAYASWVFADDALQELTPGEVDKVVIAIIQPNSRGEPTLKTWETTDEYAETFGALLEDAIEQARKATPESTDLLSMGPHCKFCPAEAICPAKRGLLDLELVAAPEVTADLGQYLDRWFEIEKVGRALLKFAHEQAEQGVQIDGYKLVQKRPTRRWTDEAEVEEIVRRSKKVKMEETHKSTLLSPAQMQALYRDKKLSFDKLGEYIASVSSGTTLAPASDKRPEALPPGAVKRLAARSG